MTHEQTTYDKIRSRIQLGDIIAFDGRSIYSWLVRTGTGARISHVGIACKTKVASYGHSIMEICESVKQGEDHETGQPITGVTRNRLSSRIANYNGEVYWFPLSPAARAAARLSRCHQLFALCHGPTLRHAAGHTIRPRLLRGSPPHPLRL